jgi:hypothetical protein
MILALSSRVGNDRHDQAGPLRPQNAQRVGAAISAIAYVNQADRVAIASATARPLPAPWVCNLLGLEEQWIGTVA